MTLLGGLSTLLLAAPAEANHGDMVLEVSRELTASQTGQKVTLTARLQNADGTPAIDGSGNGAFIDFEIIGGGSIDGEGGANTPESPDLECKTSTASVVAPYPECTVEIFGINAGTALVRAWIDEDGTSGASGGGTEADRDEGRLSSRDSDCTSEAEPPTDDTGREAQCEQGAEQPGDLARTEPDNTDVVQVSFSNPAATAAKLDCPTGIVGPSGAGEVTVVNCKVTDAGGNPLAGVRVDGEHLSGAQDPDASGTRNPADYNGAPTADKPECVSGANGLCPVRITAVDNSTDNATICFWVDSDPGVDGTGLVTPDPSYAVAGSEADGGGCATEPAAGAADDSDLTDIELVKFEAPVLAGIDVEPESASRTVGTDHVLTARLLDQFGRQWKSSASASIEIQNASVSDTDGSTPATPFRTCTTPGTGENPGVCSFPAYTSATAGLDAICGFVSTITPSATCNGEAQATDTSKSVDVVVVRWNAVATTPPPGGSTAQGYSLVGEDGTLYAFGSAKNFGDMRGTKLNQPIIGVAYTPGGGGYWLVAKDGGIFSFGDADFKGSMGDQKLNSPVIGMAATPTGKGYWLFAGDGGIFSFGDAQFFGSMGDQKLNAPVLNMEPLASGTGYWLVAGDGGIFSFGKAEFQGSMGDQKINQPVFDMTSTDTDKGYWLIARDGGVFSFGDAAAKFFGNPVDETNPKPKVIGMDSTPNSQGYWIADATGKVWAYGNAQALGDRFGAANPAPMVGFAAVPGK